MDDLSNDWLVVVSINVDRADCEKIDWEKLIDATNDVHANVMIE